MADFVKSISREAGRVTELVAKPLLRLFPEALRFSQPLSGMIAGRRKVFRKVAENDYGVDIGILRCYKLGCEDSQVNMALSA